MIHVEGECYPVIEDYGERVIGPCLNWERFNQEPDTKKEITIHRIPRTLTEEQLMPIFCSVGPVYKLTLRMRFKGQHRGYAYLQYVFEEHYYLAFRILSEKVFVTNLMDYKVRMSSSLNICTLEMGGLGDPRNLRLVLEHLDMLTPCCIAIEAETNEENGQLELKITFTNRICAAQAKRRLLSHLSVFGRSASVKWQPRRKLG